MSVSVLTVIVAAIWSPATMVRALDPSCVRTMVQLSPLPFDVTRMISALEASGCTLAGQTVQLKGAAGKRAPAPVVTDKVVPDVGGDGAVATALMAKLA